MLKRVRRIWRMRVMLRVTCLGILVEYSVPHPDNYSLEALCADVYMRACSDMPHPCEKFKLEAKLSWIGEYRLIEDDADLQDIFLVFKARGLKIIRFQMESLPLAVLPAAEYVNQDSYSAHDSYSVNQDTPIFVEISSRVKKTIMKVFISHHQLKMMTTYQTMRAVLNQAQNQWFNHKSQELQTTIKSMLTNMK